MANEEQAFDLEDYYAELKLMFQSRGWAYLCEELRHNAEVINNLQSVSDSEDLRYKQGQLATIGVLLNWPETIERAEAEADE